MTRKWTKSYVDDVSIIAELQVVEHGSLREVTKLGTIFNTVELGGVHAVDFVLFEDLLLYTRI